MATPAKSTTHPAVFDFIHDVPAKACKRDKSLARVTPGVRLYCTQREEAWNLQIFAPLMRGPFGTKAGTTDVYATAHMSRDDLLAVRGAIDTLLGDV